jgi:hypothetical protein
MQFINVQTILSRPIEECAVCDKVLEYSTLSIVASLRPNTMCEAIMVTLYERISLITEIGRPL